MSYHRINDLDELINGYKTTKMGDKSFPLTFWIDNSIAITPYS